MGTNISFGTYTPPKPAKGGVDINIGVFFDGTLNNKDNTDERKAKTKVYKKHGGDSDENTSYNNDWSNVARLWENYTTESIYVEGMGTVNKKGDVTDGYAYGSKDTGIKAKVKIGCEKIAVMAKIKKDKDKGRKTVETLILDVFGFSRGAAAARHFVYEVSKRKVKSDPKSVDFGLLGVELNKQGVKTDTLKLKIRFLGIFDTVSSYSEDVWTDSPNFSNDIEELHLDDISKAKKIIHFVAENEHRENFDLTDLVTHDKMKRKNVYLGTEKTFPGVHCDIGGSYENGTEKKDEIINGSEAVLLKRKSELISQGWFNDEQLIVHDWSKKLSSYIPLHFMAKYGVNNGLFLDVDQIENNKYSIAQDNLLVRIKKRLENYVMSDGKPYKFKWFTDVHEKYKGPKVTEQKYLDYQKELKEQEDLRKLRNKYLHWSADYDYIGMDPRSNGKRVIH